MQQAVEFFGNEMKIKLVTNIFYWNSCRLRSFPVSKFQFLFSFSFLDHYNSSSSSVKTTTDNSSSRFNFCNENYTDPDSRFYDPWPPMFLLSEWDDCLVVQRGCTALYLACEARQTFTALTLIDLGCELALPDKVTSVTCARFQGQNVK